LRPKAKEHLNLSKGRGKKGSQNSAKVIDTRKEVAQSIGTSHDTLHKVKAIAERK
jgi:hypothetical protein